MRMQSNQASCGPTALYNAGCALGKKLSLEECERACKTTTDGTSLRQLKSGALKLGFTVEDEMRERDSHVAWLRARYYLDRGNTLLVTVDADTHWAAIIGMFAQGERILLADSAEAELVLGYSANEFLMRWEHPEARRPYYAMVVS